MSEQVSSQEAVVEDSAAHIPETPVGEQLRQAREARGLKIDLGLEFPKLQAGHLYFLSPTYLH